MKKACLCFSLLIIFIITISGCADLNDYLVIEPLQLPVVTGQYGVGTSQMLFIDHVRRETFLKDAPEKFRRVMVRFWYPTAKTIINKTINYMDEQTAAYFTRKFGINYTDGLKMLETVKTNTVENAELAGGRFPVLVFSPGLESAYCAYQSLLEEAASHGYIVAAVNHPFISGITVFPDGRAQEMDPSMDKLESMKTNFPIVVDDLKFIIAQLKEINGDSSGQLYNKLDLSKIGAFGHSFGGAASVRLSMEEPKCKAAINLEGWLEGQGYEQRLKIPLLFMAGNRYTDSKDPNWNVAWRNLESGFRVRIKGATHINFCDLGIIMHHFFPQVPTKYFGVHLGDVSYWRLGNIKPNLAIRITNDYIVAFFNHTLKGEPVEALKNVFLKYNAVKFEMKTRNLYL